VKELTRGQVHHAFEAVGSKRTAEQSFQMLGPAGTATIIGMIPFGTNIELHGFEFLRGEKRIQGSTMGSNRFRTDMPRLIDHYLKGRLHLDQWISARIKLAEINEGFANMKTGKVLRSVIMFDA
jgi:S-(hydroxymethyl)glutathione dehydrogenase/alcohol dehydrogenase